MLPLQTKRKHQFQFMKEKDFVNRNSAKWTHVLNMVSKKSMASGEDLAEAYLDITSDLAYSQTHYPDSSTTNKLNELAFLLHNHIYKREPTKWSRFITIWTRELPTIMYECRKSLLFSFIVFMFFTLVGVFSQLHDAEYARLILGDSYVNMTLENINQGVPTHVYNTSPEIDDFIYITINNLLVDLKTFVSGIFTSLGTIYILFINAIMLGSFQTFFFQQGVGWESVLAIWQHGALEIPACIISGAAGITLGHGWLFPKSYSRFEAFKRSAKKGLKIMMAIIPITIIAGFIESFITRHTEIPDAIRIAAILAEFAFVILYFVVYPFKFRKEAEHV